MIHLLQHIKLKSDTGTGRYRVESAMCKEFANNQEFEICGAWCSQGRQRSHGEGGGQGTGQS